MALLTIILHLWHKKIVRFMLCWKYIILWLAELINMVPDKMEV